jgi:hypothetical protein
VRLIHSSQLYELSQGGSHLAETGGWETRQMKEEQYDQQQGATSLDSERLKMLLFELSCEHDRLHLPLVEVAACGSALAANPVSPKFRSEAREAWRHLMAVVEEHLRQDNDATLASRAEKLNLISSSLREAVTKASDGLGRLANQIAAVDFERASVEAIARAGDGMRSFATALDDLASREEHELMPKLRRILFEHVSPAQLK